MMMNECANRGTCTFTWHDGRPRYDEVAWDPRTITAAEANHLADLILRRDPRATRVQVEYAEDRFAEAVRTELKAA